MNAPTNHIRKLFDETRRTALHETYLGAAEKVNAAFNALEAALFPRAEEAEVSQSADAHKPPAGEGIVAHDASSAGGHPESAVSHEATAPEQHISEREHAGTNFKLPSGWTKEGEWFYYRHPAGHRSCVHERNAFEWHSGKPDWRTGQSDSLLTAMAAALGLTLEQGEHGWLCSVPIGGNATKQAHGATADKCAWAACEAFHAAAHSRAAAVGLPKLVCIDASNSAFEGKPQVHRLTRGKLYDQQTCTKAGHVDVFDDFKLRGAWLAKRFRDALASEIDLGFGLPSGWEPSASANVYLYKREGSVRADINFDGSRWYWNGHDCGTYFSGDFEGTPKDVLKAMLAALGLETNGNCDHESCALDVLERYYAAQQTSPTPSAEEPAQPPLSESSQSAEGVGEQYPCEPGATVEALDDVFSGNVSNRVFTRGKRYAVLGVSVGRLLLRNDLGNESWTQRDWFGRLLDVNALREALERALGLETDPVNHTPEWFAELVLKLREIGNAQPTSRIDTIHLVPDSPIVRLAAAGIDISGRALKHYGRGETIRKAEEECTELTLALKHREDGKASDADVITEVADIFITALRMRELEGAEAVDAAITAKLERLVHRIDTSEPLPKGEENRYWRRVKELEAEADQARRALKCR